MNHSLIHRSTICLSLAILFLAECGTNPKAVSPTTRAFSVTASTIPEDYSELVSQFDYVLQAPLDVQEKSVTLKNEIEIHDISFASPAGSRITAYLLVPTGKGPFAGLIFSHWALGDRTEFLDEAMQVAQLGAVCLLPDSPLRRPGHSELVPDELYKQTVIELRRAVDLLILRSDVDANRLGYVGHSYGATMGSVLAGVEKRIHAYVLMAGHPQFSQTEFAAPLSNPRLDAIHYIGHAAPAALFFQFAEKDEYITKQAALQFYEAGSDPKTIQWYDASHGLNDRARLDRIAWLKRQLGLMPAE